LDPDALHCHHKSGKRCIRWRIYPFYFNTTFITPRDLSDKAHVYAILFSAENSRQLESILISLSHRMDVRKSSLVIAFSADWSADGTRSLVVALFRNFFSIYLQSLLQIPPKCPTRKEISALSSTKIQRCNLRLWSVSSNFSLIIRHD